MSNEENKNIVKPEDEDIKQQKEQTEAEKTSEEDDDGEDHRPSYKKKRVIGW